MHFVAHLYTHERLVATDQWTFPGRADQVLKEIDTASSQGLSLTQHYTSLAKLFHWLTAAAVIGMLALGWYMTSLELSPLMLKLYSWHKWIGICILLVTVLRLIWRFSHPAPPLPDDMSPVLKLGAHAGHILLYGLLLGLPLAGWIHSSASGFPVVWFSIVPVPNLVD